MKAKESDAMVDVTRTYHVKLIMTEEFTINANSAEEAERIARAKFGSDYYIDDVRVLEMYALVGYDKDNDVYEVIEKSFDLDYLIKKGEDIAEIQKETDSFRRNGNDEPFDWFEIVNAGEAEYPDCYYWASYEKAVLDMQNISKNLCSYMFEEFSSAFYSPFARTFLENVIAESEKFKSVSERCEWLAKILPEVTLKEIRDVMLR